MNCIITITTTIHTTSTETNSRFHAFDYDKYVQNDKIKNAYTKLKLFFLMFLKC